ncbi:MAG: MBL fold metallo-hydrolase [Pseudomonadota bacterium]
MTIKCSEPVVLAEGVIRWTAPNPGFMTGPGTNGYIVGNEALTFVDPGPDTEENIDAISTYCDGRLQRILVTHTHRDHCPGVRRLAALTGAEVFGTLPPPGDENDATFLPDVELQDGQLFDCGDLTLEAIHTPGHASNHYCFLICEHGMLLTGDHIMNGSTVVIAAPDGNMSAYLASLQRLLDLQFATIGPGHGEVIENPHDNIRGVIAHRLAREEKVVLAIQTLGSCTIDGLLPVAYDDVDSRLLPVARYSLCAHVQKLVEDGRVSEDAGRFATTGSVSS